MKIQVCKHAIKTKERKGCKANSSFRDGVVSSHSCFSLCLPFCAGTKKKTGRILPLLPGQKAPTLFPGGQAERKARLSFAFMTRKAPPFSRYPNADFLIGTLAAEMPVSYHQEALKAQAVAAYTYYSYQRQAAREQPNEDVWGRIFPPPPGGSPFITPR